MRRLLPILLAVAIGATLLSPAAGAKPRTTVLVPNGTYGVLTPQFEYIVFKVKDRKVSDIAFASTITCQASDAPSSEERLFSAGPRAPRGERVPRNGVLKLDWQEDGGGRFGNVHLELRFGRRVADVSIIVPEDPAGAPGDAKESCDGGAVLHFHRGFEAPRA